MNSNRDLEQDKSDLINWVTPGAEILHRGDLPGFNRMPSRQLLFQQGMLGIAEGWIPQRPLIEADTRTLAIGSCFARNFIVWLAEHGFNQTGGRSPYGTLEPLEDGFQSAAVVAQQFRWAFGEIDASSLYFVGRHRVVFEATEERRLRLRDTLLDTDVLIVTLGLSEIWYDQITGEPLWHSPQPDKYDPARHVFRVESVEQTRHWFEVIEVLRRRHMPRLKLVYTVSPIPLNATFRPVSAITADCASKSILRAALDEFLRAHVDVVGSEVFYFPSYEFVTKFFEFPFQEDNRHVTNFVAGAIMNFFAETYCALGDRRSRVVGSLAEIEPGKQLEDVMVVADSGKSITPAAEAAHRIRDLEARVAELDRVCSERSQVIEELDQAARERLGLIEQLQKVAEERLAGMQALSAVAEERLARIQSLERKVAG